MEVKLRLPRPSVISGPRLQIAGHGSREHVTVAEQAENFRDTLVTMSDEGENYTISAQFGSADRYFSGEGIRLVREYHDFSIV